MVSARRSSATSKRSSPASSPPTLHRRTHRLSMHSSIVSHASSGRLASRGLFRRVATRPRFSRHQADRPGSASRFLLRSRPLLVSPLTAAARLPTLPRIRSSRVLLSAALVALLSFAILRFFRPLSSLPASLSHAPTRSMTSSASAQTATPTAQGRKSSVEQPKMDRPVVLRPEEGQAHRATVIWSQCAALRLSRLVYLRADSFVSRGLKRPGRLGERVARLCADAQKGRGVGRRQVGAHERVSRRSFRNLPLRCGGARCDDHSAVCAAETHSLLDTLYAARTDSSRLLVELCQLGTLHCLKSR